MSAQPTRKARTSPWPALLTIAAVATALLGMVLYMHYAWDVPMGTLTQDPLFRQPAYKGFLSQSGILLWAAAAAVCGITAAVLSSRSDAGAATNFFRAAGLLTLFLCLDDAFMLHDAVLPDQLGVPEEMVYAGYVSLILIFLLVFRRQILESNYLALVIAFALFGLSVLADMRELPGLDPFLLEDGAKAIGIVSWLTYFFSEGAAALRSSALA